MIYKRIKYIKILLVNVFILLFITACSSTNFNINHSSSKKVTELDFGNG